MSITLFFVDAFSSALERGIATPADLLRHFTPEVLSIHLPRHLWARLLTACLGAPRVDATTIVDTVGVGNLCEHMPKPLLWTCLADLAAAALGGTQAMRTTTSAQPTVGPTAHGETLLPPPPGAQRHVANLADAVMTSAPTPVAAAGGSSPVITSAQPPAASSGAPIDAASSYDSSRVRTSTRPPLRGLGTSRSPSAAGASSRRPQVSATPPTPPPGPTPASAVPPPPRSPARRDDLDFEVETDIHTDWKDKEPIPVTDEMVDWPAAEETASGAALDRQKR